MFERSEGSPAEIEIFYIERMKSRNFNTNMRGIKCFQRMYLTEEQEVLEIHSAMNKLIH